MSASPSPQTPEERLTYLEVMLQTVSDGIMALNAKLDRLLTALDARAGTAWVEKLEKRLSDLEREVRGRPTYLSAGAWAAVLAMLGLLVGLFFRFPA